MTTPAGSASSSGGIYTFNAGPSVATISPVTGPLTGNQPVTITGTNFVPGSTFVTIGGVAATIGMVSGTTISATTPANVAGPQSVVVTTTTGGTGSLVNGYTYQDVPTVSAISPASGPLGGGQAVTITGQNFLAATAVSIGGSAATIVGTPTATTITATTGAHAAGVADVVVTTPSGSGGTGNNLYTYADSPTVTVISPNNGPLVGGQSVTITGTNFTTNSTSVTIGGQPASNVVVTGPTTLTAKTPAHAAGQVDVVVSTPSSPQSAPVTCSTPTELSRS